MALLEWRLTLLSLVVLPLFIIPAKRVGRRLQAITRDADGPQRLDEHHDDRAVQRVRRPAGQAVRPHRRRGALVRRAGRRRARHRHPGRAVRPHVLHRPRPRRRARHGRRLLGRRASRSSTARSRSARWWRWPPTSPASTGRSPRSPTPASTCSRPSCRSSGCSRCSTRRSRSSTGPAPSTSSTPAAASSSTTSAFRYPDQVVVPTLELDPTVGDRPPGARRRRAGHRCDGDGEHGDERRWPQRRRHAA